MTKISINLPKTRRLDLKLVKRQKNPNDKPLLPSLGEIRRARAGNKISRFFRLIFEHDRIKKVLGTNLAVIAIATSLMPAGVSTNLNHETETTIITQANTPLTTEVVVRYPVNSIVISQGYRLFHPGLDLDGVTGYSIYPIMNGKVEDISRSPFAYGNAILIDHGESLTSLYAHLSRIDVEKDQEVTTKTKIGEMGATGRAYGDHLHLEVRNDGRAINPFTVLPVQQ